LGETEDRSWASERKPRKKREAAQEKPGNRQDKPKKTQEKDSGLKA
jgi:hypothetical protein